MKRHVVTILTAASLLACVLTLWNWAINLLGETVRIEAYRDGFALASIEASNDFVTSQFGNTSRDVIRFLHRVPTSDRRSALGFTYQSGTRYNAPYWFVVVPYWFITVLTALLPIRWWFLRRRRRAWAATGRCLGCGYDLRATPGRCPECGAVGAAHQTPTAQPAIP